MAEEAKAAEKAELSFWRSLFDDISIAQLLAGALAAVTSMLLASRIGIAGSVIGVAVGSIVSAVASQVYKKFLSASAEKLKDMAPDHGPFAPLSHRGDSQNDDAASSAQTAVLAGVPAAETAALPASAAQGGGPASARSTKSDVYAEAARVRSRSARARKARIQRNAVIVAVLSALVAIALSAVVIEVVTAGQGVGVKPEPLMPSAPWSSPAKEAPAPVEGDIASGAASSSDQSGSSEQDGAQDASSSQGGVSDSQDSQAASSDGQQSDSAQSEDGSSAGAAGQGDAESGSQDSGSAGQESSSGSDASSSGGTSDASGSASSGQTGAPNASAGSSSQAGSSSGTPAASVVLF